VGGKRKILIVEDEFIAAMCLQEELLKRGYEVSELVSSGEEAIKRAEVDKFDVVIMDIHLLGELNGMEAGEQIFARFGTPIVYVTGYSDKRIFDRIKHTQPIACIVKPININKLDMIIKSFFQNQPAN
jgi:two-component system, response regulator PdtaR